MTLAERRSQLPGAIVEKLETGTQLWQRQDTGSETEMGTGSETGEGRLLRQCGDKGSTQSRVQLPRAYRQLREHTAALSPQQLLTV